MCEWPAVVHRLCVCECMSVMCACVRVVCCRMANLPLCPQAVRLLQEKLHDLRSMFFGELIEQT